MPCSFPWTTIFKYRRYKNEGTKNITVSVIAEETQDFKITTERKYLGDALDEDKFKKEKDTVTVNGKDIKVTKVIYPLNQDTLYEIITSMIDDIKNDDEFIGLVAKLVGQEKEEFKSEEERVVALFT